MPTITVPTAARIRDIILSRLLGSPGISGADTAKGGFFWQLANAFAQQGRNLVVRCKELAWQCIGPTSTGDYLVAWADSVLGEGAAAATKWVGTIEIRCVNNTQTVPVGQAGTHEDGTQYVTTAAINPTDWLSGGTYYYCRPASESVTLGDVANKETLTEITLSAPPAGVYDAAYLYTTTTEAEDAETETELQDRITQHLRDMPGGGSAANYRAWCQEVSGVSDACIYPRWEGVGAAGDMSVRCVILGPPGARIVTATEEAAVEALLANRGPLFITAANTVVQIPASQAQQVVVTVCPAPGYEADYSYATYAPDVDSFDAGLRKLNLSVNPVGNLIPGNRIVISGTDHKTYQYTVQTVAVGYVTVTEPFVVNPQTAKTVRPGGPLWAPIRAAVEAVFDNLGTSASSTGTKVRWPHSDSELPSTLYLSDLYAAIDGVTGVISSTLGTPAADVTNTAAETVAPDLIRLVGTAGVSDFQILWGTAA